MNKNNNNALLSKLDALIEQVKLTNALIGAQVMGYEVQRNLMLDLAWQQGKKGSKGREYLALYGVFREINDEAH